MTAPTHAPQRRRTDTPRDRTARILTTLLPRAAIWHDDARSTRGKIDCWDVISQSADDTVYAAGIDRRNDAAWCNCPGFCGHHRCKHLDSIRFYDEQDACAAVLATETDAYVAARDRALARQARTHGLTWQEHAEWAAVGDAAAARLAQDVAA